MTPLIQIDNTAVRCSRSPSSRQEDADWLAQAIKMSGVKAKVVPGFTGIKPMPKRSDKIDPETRLIRKPGGVPKKVANQLRIEREKYQAEIDAGEQLRAMVEAL